MTTHPDNATTWRDLADQLTPRQVRLLENFGQDDAEMLDAARDCIRTNALSARIPLPAGVIDTDDWLSVTHDDVPVRSLVWSNHDTDDTYISIDGLQYGDDGRFDRHICVHAKHNEIEMDATEARAVAANLIEAADEMERLQ